MSNEYYKGILKNTAQISYSYDNSEQMVNKHAVSNATLVKVYKYNNYYDCIESIVNISDLCLNNYQLYNLYIWGDINLYDFYVTCWGNKKYLIVNFGLSLYINFDKNTCLCDKSYIYLEKYEYKIPIDKCEVEKIGISISDVSYDILKNNKIKINTKIKFRI